MRRRLIAQLLRWLTPQLPHRRDPWYRNGARLREVNAGTSHGWINWGSDGRRHPAPPTIGSWQAADYSIMWKLSTADKRWLDRQAR